MPKGDILQIRYPVLLTVQVLHHYFLDMVKTLYDNLPDAKKLKVLADYDVRSIVDIQPTDRTRRVLAGRSILFKPHGLGFTLLCKADKDGKVAAGDRLAIGEKLRFSIKIVDPYFMQYSAGFLHAEQIRVEKSSDGRSPDRFFKNIYLLRNDPTGQSPALANAPPSFDNTLVYPPESIVQFDANGDGNLEFFIAQRAVAANTVPNLNANQNWLKLEQVLPQNTNLRYLSQADLTEMELDNDLSSDLFALLEVEATKGVGIFHLYNNADELNSPQFELRFKNRLTWWRHSLAPWVKGPMTSITQSGVLPLTFRGKEKLDLTFQVTNKNGVTDNIQKKGVDAPSRYTPILPEKANNGSVTRLLSDVYI